MPSVFGKDVCDAVTSPDLRLTRFDLNEAAFPSSSLSDSGLSGRALLRLGSFCAELGPRLAIEPLNPFVVDILSFSDAAPRRPRSWRFSLSSSLLLDDPGRSPPEAIFARSAPSPALHHTSESLWAGFRSNSYRSGRRRNSSARLLFLNDFAGSRDFSSSERGIQLSTSL